VHPAQVLGGLLTVAGVDGALRMSGSLDAESLLSAGET
jgi:hypothetical protein